MSFSAADTKMRQLFMLIVNENTSQETHKINTKTRRQNNHKIHSNCPTRIGIDGDECRHVQCSHIICIVYLGIDIKRTKLLRCVTNSLVDFVRISMFSHLLSVYRFNGLFSSPAIVRLFNFLSLLSGAATLFFRSREKIANLVNSTMENHIVQLHEHSAINSVRSFATSFAWLGKKMSRKVS